MLKSFLYNYLKFKKVPYLYIFHRKNSDKTDNDWRNVGLDTVYS